MADKNGGSFNFDVPTGLIIAGFVLCPPVGVVMTVLRVLSDAYKRNVSSSQFSAEEARAEFAKTIDRAKKNPTKKTSSKKKGAGSHNPAAAVMSVAGWLVLALGVLLAINGIPDMFTPAWFTSVLPKILLCAVSAGGLLIGGHSLKKRTERLARIRLLIGERESYDLARIASASGTNIRRTRRDVQKLIDDGVFGKTAYIDLGSDCFMRSPDAKPDTAPTYSPAVGKKKNAKKSDNLGVRADNEDFRETIREIRRLNDEIEDEAVSERIYKIEEHTKNIFNYVSEHEDAMPQIRTFMNYYLPTTLKLLESYSRIEKVGVAGENMKKSKENIESTLDALEVAFRMQIDDLFRSESIDINSDISVLETMMSKDGLTDRHDFAVSSGGAAAAKAELREQRDTRNGEKRNMTE